MERSIAPPPPIPPLLSADGLIGRISPTILLIIVIFGAIFAISGLLHLLVQYLIRKSSRDADYIDSATALEGQLQQLFHLHDAGVDQSFIDSLPIFLYKDIATANDPFDCAVCLCEFESEDKLRLLPECSHAFHAECIDTWLLSHSTCPLCRTSLLPPFPSRCNYTPFVFLVESENESNGQQSEEEATSEVGSDPPPRLVPIKLGKLKSVAGEGSGSNGGALDGRRCFSMGSFDYVTEDASLVRVTVKEQVRKLNPGESLSVSKIWLRSNKPKPPAEGSSRRVFSFRLPLQEGSQRVFSFRLPLHIGGAAESGKAKGSTSSLKAPPEADVGYDVEAGRLEGGNVISRAEETPSFARRTLRWIAGKHHKVGNQSDSNPISGGEVFRHDVITS
ncbi:putative RING-H2 finger protein ATL49 [Wolffia australiana]